MNQSWDDVKIRASHLLTGQGDGSDEDCAKAIWSLLENEGLTTYKNDIERTEVLVLLLGVIEFVNDCIAIIREDNYELDILTWVSEVEINSFRIAQLIGAHFEESEEYEFEELYELALINLLDEARENIVSCINNKYEDTTDAMKFIGGFYQPASENDVTIDEDSELFDNARIPVNVMEFFSWIEDGMPRRN